MTGGRRNALLAMFIGAQLCWARKKTVCPKFFTVRLGYGHPKYHSILDL